MALKELYRLENYNGDQEGPYNSLYEGDIQDILHSHHGNDDKLHPSLHEDGIYVDINFKSACLSINALKEWFNEFYDEIINMGIFGLVKYTVEESNVFIGKSGKQVVFDSTNIIAKQVLIP